MPWTGDDADDELPDDVSVEGTAPARPPLPPDDRLWRHPSELAPALVPAGTQIAHVSPAARPGRLWSAVVVSGLSGAALALLVVGLMGRFGDDVTQRIVERVPVGDALIDRASLSSPDGAVAVAELVSPSVVRIETGGASTASSGSGIVIRDDGTILTNAHVVDGVDRVTIVLADGTGLPGHVVGTDPTTDVAVVAVDESHAGSAVWVPAVLGSASDLRVGQPAVAIGSPLGLAGGPSVTVGVVSGLGRRVVAEGQVLHDMIQTDAPIGRGSSGGALCDGRGVVVGLTTAVASSTAGSDGLGFAIPIDVASEIAERLVADGAVRWVWLGIEGSDLPATASSVPGLAGTGGVRVEGVTASGPADAAGIAAGDIVVAVDGTRIATMSDLVVALRRYTPGDTVEVEVRREGENHTMSATLAERPG